MYPSVNTINLWYTAPGNTQISVRFKLEFIKQCIKSKASTDPSTPSIPSQLARDVPLSQVWILSAASTIPSRIAVNNTSTSFPIPNWFAAFHIAGYCCVLLQVSLIVLFFLCASIWIRVSSVYLRPSIDCTSHNLV